MTLQLSRRDLLIGGAVVMAAPASFATPGPRHGGRVFLYEAAADEAGQWLQQARRHDWTPTPVGRDLWHVAQRLNEAWRQRPAAVTGVTSAATFFIFEQIAGRRGLRLAERHGAWWTFVPGPEGAGVDPPLARQDQGARSSVLRSMIFDNRP